MVPAQQVNVMDLLRRQTYGAAPDQLSSLNVNSFFSPTTQSSDASEAMANALTGGTGGLGSPSGVATASTSTFGKSLGTFAANMGINSIASMALGPLGPIVAMLAKNVISKNKDPNEQISLDNVPANVIDALSDPTAISSDTASSVAGTAADGPAGEDSSQGSDGTAVAGSPADGPAGEGTFGGGNGFGDGSSGVGSASGSGTSGTGGEGEGEGGDASGPAGGEGTGTSGTTGEGTGFFDGGFVPGPDLGHDSVPVNLAGGEVVIPSRIVDMLGHNFFEDLLMTKSPMEIAAEKEAKVAAKMKASA